MKENKYSIIFRKKIIVSALLLLTIFNQFLFTHAVLLSLISEAHSNLISNFVTELSYPQYYLSDHFILNKTGSNLLHESSTMRLLDVYIIFSDYNISAKQSLSTNLRSSFFGFTLLRSFISTNTLLRSPPLFV